MLRFTFPLMFDHPIDNFVQAFLIYTSKLRPASSLSILATDIAVYCHPPS